MAAPAVDIRLLRAKPSPLGAQEQEGPQLRGNRRSASRHSWHHPHQHPGRTFPQSRAPTRRLTADPASTSAHNSVEQTRESSAGGLQPFFRGHSLGTLKPPCGRGSLLGQTVPLDFTDPACDRLKAPSRHPPLPSWPGGTARRACNAEPSLAFFHETTHGVGHPKAP